MRARSKVVLGGFTAFGFLTALVMACGEEHTPASGPTNPSSSASASSSSPAGSGSVHSSGAAAGGNPTQVQLKVDGGGRDADIEEMRDAIANDAPAPTASISTTGEEGPPSETSSVKQTHVFARVVRSDDDTKGESVDLYADGSVWWRSPRCPKGVKTQIDGAKVEKLYEDLNRRRFFDMQPVAGPQKECRVAGATTVHADGKKRSAEHSSNACSDAAQKQSVGDWKSRVLAVAGAEPEQCKMPK